METPSDLTWEDVRVVAEVAGLEFRLVGSAYEKPVYSIRSPNSPFTKYYRDPKPAIMDIPIIATRSIAWTITAEL